MKGIKQIARFEIKACLFSCYALSIKIMATKKKSAKRKSPAAVALGRRGGKARLKKLTPEKRTDVARRAAEARWGKLERKVEKLQAQFDALTPEQRAQFEQGLQEFMQEHGAVFEWQKEIRARILDGSMTAEQANAHLDAAARDLWPAVWKAAQESGTRAAKRRTRE